MLEDASEKDVPGEVSSDSVAQTSPSPHSSEYVAGALDRAYDNLYHNTRKEGLLRGLWEKFTGLLRKKRTEQPMPYSEKRLEQAANNLMLSPDVDGDMWNRVRKQFDKGLSEPVQP